MRLESSPPAPTPTLTSAQDGPPQVSQMGLAARGRAQKDEVVFGAQDVELAQVQDERLLQRALEAEVELRQCSAGGEARLLEPRLAALGVSRCDFGCEQRLGAALRAPLLGAGALGQLRQGVRGGRLQCPEELGELGLCAQAGISAS
jgi:hypothetical protein